MKKSVSLIAISILFSTITSAQIQRNKPTKSAVDTAVTATSTSPTPVIANELPQSSRKEKRAMMKDLNLTRPQMKQLKELKQSSKSQKEAIESNTQLTEEEKKKQLRELKKNQLKKMQGIFTPEQIQKLKEMRKQKAGNKMEMDDLEIE